MTSNAFLRRALPIGAALAIGSGAGAAIYAGTTGGSSTSPTTVVGGGNRDQTKEQDRHILL